MEQLNHAIVANAHTSMYLIHKYWARKPHNVVSDYINNYSKEGDIILDPFSGSGVTAIEALKLNRKAVAVDLNPISEFILTNTLSRVQVGEIENAFSSIEKSVKNKIEGLYYTICRKCGEEKAIILATIWERNKKAPKELRYICPTCGKKYATAPSKKDGELLEKIEKLNPEWYPKKELAYNGKGFMKREGKKSVDELFTKRNLYSLSLILKEIEKIENKKISSVFKFAFTSMVHLASKMCPVAKEGGKGHWSALSTTSFWALQSFWTPPLFMESNVWMLFSSAISGKQGIINGISDAQTQIKQVKFADDFKELNNGANIFVKTANALDLTKLIPANSIDYIFTDPPYGGAVQYFELSTLWASWLKIDLDYADEITINSQQEKNFEYYHKMLKAAFREMYQVLKPEKYLTVTFHSTDIAVWNSVIRAVVLSGFDLEKIIYQPPARTSAKGLLQPYGSAVGDYYIRFKKPKNEKIISESQMDMQSYEREVVLAAKRIIEERGEPTIYQHILNGIMVELKGGRNAPIGAKKFEDVLKEHTGKEIELIPTYNEKGKVAGKKWWLKGRDFSNFSTPSLSDRVERVILNVLDKKVKATFDDILQEIFIHFPNALTPDSQDIKSMLEDYAERTKDGMWRLKADLQEKQRISQHTKMIYYLAVLGKKAGYDICVGLKEQGDIYEGKPLRNLCDNIKTFRFVPQETAALSRIKEIDLLWLEDGRIRYEFEVENTTGISEAIIRGSNIPEDLKPKRFIIIPEEREKKLHKKLQEPILQQAIQKTKWEFILYKDLEQLFKATKKEFDEKKLNQIARMPRDAPEGQQTKILGF